MSMARITVVTLGVRDLAKSTAFYTAVFKTQPNTKNEGVSFFELPGTWLSLFPLQNLAADIAPQLPLSPGGFGGVTLAHNARSKEEIFTIFQEAEAAGATIAKQPQATFWGGFGGYFADLDGYYWEIVWGPMFDFGPDGTLRFKR